MPKSVTITGADRLLTKLDPRLVEPSAARILERGVHAGHAAARYYAPFDTGHLHDSLERRIDAGFPPRWAMYGTDVDYGLYLNSPINREPRYRRGRHAGTPTRNWFTRTVPIPAPPSSPPSRSNATTSPLTGTAREDAHRGRPA